MIGEKHYCVGMHSSGTSVSAVIRHELGIVLCWPGNPNMNRRWQGYSLTNHSLDTLAQGYASQGSFVPMLIQRMTTSHIIGGYPV